MKIIVDLDDTVCDTNAYSEEYIKKFIEEHSLPVKFVSTIARFAEAKFDWDYDTALKWYKTYGDEMMLHFPVKNDAVEVLNRLHDAGNEIVICTARETDWHTDPRGITQKWLNNVGLKFDKIYIGRVDKEKVCEEEKANVFIDDDLSIVKRVVDNVPKCKVFLSTTDYNKSLSTPVGVQRIERFAEIEKCVKLKDDKEK